MKVFITGGNGQVGSTVADMMLARGDTVVSIDNFDTGRRDNLLAQDRLGIDPPGVTEQGCHQLGGIGYAGFLKLGLQGGQNVALDHVQQRVVTGYLKPFAEQQLRGDFDVIPGTII